jgi:hypothetical protein
MKPTRFDARGLRPRAAASTVICVDGALPEVPARRLDDRHGHWPVRRHLSEPLLAMHLKTS